MVTLAVLFVFLCFAGFFGINQSKNASSSASTTSTTDSDNDNSNLSHNTDNSVGAGSTGTILKDSNNLAASIAGNDATINVSDGSEGALALAKSSVERASDQANNALAAASRIGSEAFASQSHNIDEIVAAAAGRGLPGESKNQLWLMGLAVVAILGAGYLFMKGRR